MGDSLIPTPNPQTERAEVSVPSQTFGNLGCLILCPGAQSTLRPPILGLSKEIFHIGGGGGGKMTQSVGTSPPRAEEVSSLDYVTVGNTGTSQLWHFKQKTSTGHYFF
jgi:hypothetical protein